MTVPYHPDHYWAVAFARHGSGLQSISVWRNAIVLALIFALPCAVLEHYDWLDRHGDFSQLTLPFSVLLSLIISFRLNDSYRKWERASALILSLHSSTRSTVAKLCAMIGDPPSPDDEEGVARRAKATELIITIRRMLVLGCVFTRNHVVSSASLDVAINTGLLLEDEAVALTQKKTSIADSKTGDGVCAAAARTHGARAERANRPSARGRVAQKSDKYPTKNRPAWAFQRALACNFKLLRHAASPGATLEHSPQHARNTRPTLSPPFTTRLRTRSSPKLLHRLSDSMRYTRYTRHTRYARYTRHSPGSDSMRPRRSTMRWTDLF